jgi:hypothetical protein
MAEVKPSSTPEFVEEFDTQTLVRTNKNVRAVRLIESVRQGLTVITLLLGLTVIGTIGNSLMVYNRTNIDSILPIWPADFNLSPTFSILAGGSIIVFFSLLSIVGSKIASVRFIPLRFLHAISNIEQIASHGLIHPILSLIVPTAVLITTIVSTALFYAINASSTTDTIQSWSCRWTSINMDAEPHFDRICHQSMAGLYITIILIPVSVIVLGLAGAKVVFEKKGAGSPSGSIIGGGEERKTPSPALS